MSYSINMPPPPGVSLGGRVIRHHRMQGHYIDAGEPLLDVLLGEIHILTFRASEAGKILQIAAVGAVVGPNAHVVEITTVGRPTWEVFIAYRQADSPAHARGIGERLIARFGRGQVFKDVESLNPSVHLDGGYVQRAKVEDTGTKLGCSS